MKPLRIVPISAGVANGFVATWHRHHQPPAGALFPIGVASDDTLVGVGIVGRPVARHYDDGLTVEVTRIATDGTPNTCSMLYGAAWRAARARGYARALTYNRDDETGASLRAAGWVSAAKRRARPGWDVPSRRRDTADYDPIIRRLWIVGAWSWDETGNLHRGDVPPLPSLTSAPVGAEPLPQLDLLDGVAS